MWGGWGGQNLGERTPPLPPRFRHPWVLYLIWAPDLIGLQEIWAQRNSAQNIFIELFTFVLIL